MEDDLYCKVYLEIYTEPNAIKSLIASISGGKIAGRTVEAKGLQVDVFENRPIGQPNSSEDFVRWPFYLEIEPLGDDVKFDSFVGEIASLLVALRKEGVRSVASCDFEEQLAAAMV